MNATRDKTPGTDPSSGGGFDQAMQALHATGLDHVEARTLARLRADRHGLRTTQATGLRPGWMLGSAFAVVATCALGIAWLQSPTSAPLPGNAVVTTSAPPSTDDGFVTALAAAQAEVALNPLDEDPDLYLWLAANDEALPSILER